MPKLTTQIPRYCKHRPSGQAFVKLAGRMVYLGPHGTARSRAEYDRVIAEWIGSGRRLPPKREAQDVTVVEVCAAYSRHAVAFFRTQQLQTRIVSALRLLRELYGRTTAEQFGPLSLKVIRQKMVDSGKSRRYINDTIAEIKRIFRWAASEEMVSHDIYLRLQTVAGLAKGRSNAREATPVPPVPDGSVEQTLLYLSPVVRDMVRLQRLTGARPAEVCLLQPKAVDRTGDVWIYRPEAHKTLYRDQLREIAIGPRGQEILEPYLSRDPHAYCFSPTDAVADWQQAKRKARKTRVQPSQRDRTKSDPKLKPGDRYTTASYRRAIHRACDRAGIERWSPNQLRHTMATEVRKQFGLEAAQVSLGHARADVTQIYAEKNLSLAIQVARQLG